MGIKTIRYKNIKKIIGYFPIRMSKLRLWELTQRSDVFLNIIYILIRITVMANKSFTLVVRLLVVVISTSARYSKTALIIILLFFQVLTSL